MIADLILTIIQIICIFSSACSSLTFEGARRAVEQDLGMKRFSLDVHKKFIKRCLEEVYKFVVE